jgi:hypothetical protein
MDAEFHRIKVLSPITIEWHAEPIETQEDIDFVEDLYSESLELRLLY